MRDAMSSSDPVAPSSDLPAASGSRPKIARARASSPAQGDSGTKDSRPQKRARKAVNCEPCRGSKLKCDRNRPCSSCVLRGTVSQCYQDGRGNDSRYSSSVRGVEPAGASRLQQGPIDPAEEIANVEVALGRLKAYIYPNNRPAIRLTSPSRLRSNSSSLAAGTRVSARLSKAEAEESTPSSDLSAPSIQVQGGLYAGPTSAALHLRNTVDDMGDPPLSDSPTNSRSSDSLSTQAQYPPAEFLQLPEGGIMQEDSDLCRRLPSIVVMDALVEHYFHYASWVYRHVNRISFLSKWEKFKTGKMNDRNGRVVLATLACILAVSMNYLPQAADWSLGLQGHELYGWESLHAVTFVENAEVLGERCFEISTVALQRHRNSAAAGERVKEYTLDLMELLLIRCHYRTLAKKESEDIWAGAGELVTIGMAMGLHRDPGLDVQTALAKVTTGGEPSRERAKVEKEVLLAERRRWVWWHVILLERWQAFMFGRPLLIATHHWDTKLPSYCPASVDPTGRYYEPNLALFRLAHCLGYVMDTAVSVSPQPYSTILQHDAMLLDWLENLPEELDLDDFRLNRHLTSNEFHARRLGVQSVVLRTSYNHIRFTLHRPYASRASTTASKSPAGPVGDPNSLDIAVHAASELVNLVQKSHEMVDVRKAFPGHMNWGAFHCFSAAMFFSFQLISNPTQPGTSLFRVNIRKARTIMEAIKTEYGDTVADKALVILKTVEPLYEGLGVTGGERERAMERGRILHTLRTLAFPYHDSHDPHRHNKAFSPSPYSGSSLEDRSYKSSASVSPPRVPLPPFVHQAPAMPPYNDVGAGQQQQQIFATSSIRDQHGQGQPSFQQSLSMPNLYTSQPMIQSTPEPQHMGHRGYPGQSMSPVSPSTGQFQQGTGMPSGFPTHGQSNGYAYGPYHDPIQQQWGAGLGMEQQEWNSFVNEMQGRPAPYS